MRLRRLKPLRAVAAVVFLAATSTLFLDYRELGAAAMADLVLFLQFVPSALAFLDGPTLAAAGFLAVLAVTALFGRVYCSTVCPLGAVQDGVSRACGRAGKPYGFAKPHTALRYGVLGLTLLTFAAGSGLALNLLDPFSGFGRILANLVRPAVLAANNLAAPVFEAFGSHAVYRMEFSAAVPAAIVAALATLAAAGWLSARHGRLYCNAVCPVGTFLGLCAKAAPFRIRIDADACTRCGRCERACKASCIDFAAGTVDAARCVSCFNCLTACRDNALRMSPPPRRSARHDAEAPGRRQFLLGLAAGGAALSAPPVLAALPPDFVPSRPTTIPEGRTSPTSPPGSRSVERLTAQCTGCHLCVAACPSRVIAPSTLEYGLSGMLQVRMDFHTSYCRYDCTVCSDICPTGAILPLTKEAKHQTQIGLAHFIKENCVVYTDNTNCGACSEHCPTKAVHMVPYQGMPGRKLVIPKMDPTICVGCGACEYACPTRPYRAIYVDGHPVHQAAKKPVFEKLELAPEEEDFPF